MSAVLLAAALAAAQPAAPQPQWVSLGQDNVARYQYDPASVRRDGDQVFFTIHSQALNPQGHPYAAFLARHRLDCRRGALIIVGITGYDAAGTAVFTRDSPEGQQTEIPMTAGSPQVRARDLLCPASAQQ